MKDRKDRMNALMQIELDDNKSKEKDGMDNWDEITTEEETRAVGLIVASSLLAIMCSLF